MEKLTDAMSHQGLDDSELLPLRHGGHRRADRLQGSSGRAHGHRRIQGFTSQRTCPVCWSLQKDRRNKEQTNKNNVLAHSNC